LTKALRFSPILLFLFVLPLAASVGRHWVSPGLPDGIQVLQANVLALIIGAAAAGLTYVYVVPRLLGLVNPVIPQSLAANKAINVLVVGAVFLIGFAIVAYIIKAVRLPSMGVHRT
jgi:hypothetical protein